MCCAVGSFAHCVVYSARVRLLGLLCLTLLRRLSFTTTSILSFALLVESPKEGVADFISWLLIATGLLLVLMIYSFMHIGIGNSTYMTVFQTQPLRLTFYYYKLMNRLNIYSAHRSTIELKNNIKNSCNPDCVTVCLPNPFIIKKMHGRSVVTLYRVPTSIKINGTRTPHSIFSTIRQLNGRRVRYMGNLFLSSIIPNLFCIKLF